MANDKRPFTREEAEEICEDFADLVDTELHFGGKTLVINEVNMKIDGYDADGQPLYGVLLQCENANDADDLAAIDIREYVVTFGVNYNFPG